MQQLRRRGRQSSGRKRSTQSRDALWRIESPGGKGCAELADETFSPTFLRNATAYGFSPKLRTDLVVNNLVGYALTTGDILIKSDGMPWRPLVHASDIARAFIAVLEADRTVIHNQTFNVGRSDENYRVRQVADLVHEIVPNCQVRYADTAGPDMRNYRVSCRKIESILPSFQPIWTVRKGIEELYEAYQRVDMTESLFLGPRLMRIKTIQDALRQGLLESRSQMARRITPCESLDVSHQSSLYPSLKRCPTRRL